MKKLSAYLRSRSEQTRYTIFYTLMIFFGVIVIGIWIVSLGNRNWGDVYIPFISRFSEEWKRGGVIEQDREIVVGDEITLSATNHASSTFSISEEVVGAGE